MNYLFCFLLLLFSYQATVAQENCLHDAIIYRVSESWTAIDSMVNNLIPKYDSCVTNEKYCQQLAKSLMWDTDSNALIIGFYVNESPTWGCGYVRHRQYNLPVHQSSAEKDVYVYFGNDKIFGEIWLRMSLTNQEFVDEFGPFSTLMIDITSEKIDYNKKIFAPCKHIYMKNMFRIYHSQEDGLIKFELLNKAAKSFEEMSSNQ